MQGIVDFVGEFFEGEIATNDVAIGIDEDVARRIAQTQSLDKRVGEHMFEIDHRLEGVVLRTFLCFLQRFVEGKVDDAQTFATRGFEFAQLLTKIVVVAVPVGRKGEQRGLSFEVCRVDGLFVERAGREMWQLCSNGRAELWAQSGVNGHQLLVGGLLFAEEIEEFKRRLFVALGYSVEIVIEQGYGSQRLRVRTNVSGGAHLCIFLVELEHGKVKFRELLVVVSACDLHLLETIGVASKFHLFAWFGNERGERVVGIDQSEEERLRGGSIVRETSAVDIDAVETTLVAFHSVGRVDEKCGLVKAFNLA